MVWAIFFARWFRDNPREHPEVNAAEAALMPVRAPNEGGHLNLPWGRLLRARPVLLICGQYFACSYAWYFFITWFPTYLLEVHKFDLKQSALLAGLPLLLGGGGVFARWRVDAASATLARKRGAYEAAVRRVRIHGRGALSARGDVDQAAVARGGCDRVGKFV